MRIRYKILSYISLLFRLSYLFVPLYDIYCQNTGYGGTINKTSLSPIQNNSNIQITIDFERNRDPNFPINFKPNIKQINTRLNKPTLRFYTIENLSNNTIYGIRTYNVTPRKRAPYFKKLECFCFDEQRIKSNEIIEMPILFYIDSSILNDSNLNNDLTLLSINYTFFSSNRNRNRI
jgi:cytochrome c oxidase assembly protein subunit 11